MIQSPAVWLLLLATRQGPVSVWGRFDHQRPGMGNYELIILSAAALLLFGTIVWQVIKEKRQRDFRFNCASRMFGELCRAHRLDRSNRRLLKRLAAARNLKNATVLFVEPDYFDLADVPPGLESSASELRQLRHTLFH